MNEEALPSDWATEAKENKSGWYGICPLPSGIGSVPYSSALFPTHASQPMWLFTENVF